MGLGTLAVGITHRAGAWFEAAAAALVEEGGSGGSKFAAAAKKNTTEKQRRKLQLLCEDLSRWAIVWQFSVQQVRVFFIHLNLLKSSKKNEKKRKRKRKRTHHLSTPKKKIEKMKKPKTSSGLHRLPQAPPCSAEAIKALRALSLRGHAKGEVARRTPTHAAFGDRRTQTHSH